MTNAQVSASAAIAYSKLALAGSIVNADIATGAALAYAKLNLAAAIKDSDIAAAQNLSKLSAVTGTPTGAKFLRDDGTWNLPAGLTTYRKTTAKVVNNTTTETDLLNGDITIAAGILGTTGVLRLTAWGDWLQNTGGTTTGPQRFKLKLGATTIFDTGAPAAAVGTSASRGAFWAEVVIANAGAANLQTASMQLKLAANSGQFTAFIGALTAGEGGYGSAGNYAYVEEAFATAAVDTTASNVLALTVINPSASVSCETKLYGALVEIV